MRLCRVLPGNRASSRPFSPPFPRSFLAPSPTIHFLSPPSLFRRDCVTAEERGGVHACVRECLLGLDKHPARLVSRARELDRKYSGRITYVPRSDGSRRVVCIQRTSGRERPRNMEEREEDTCWLNRSARRTATGTRLRIHETRRRCCRGNTPGTEREDARVELKHVAGTHGTIAGATGDTRGRVRSRPERRKLVYGARWRNLWPEIAPTVSLLASRRARGSRCRLRAARGHFYLWHGVERRRCRYARAFRGTTRRGKPRETLTRSTRP